MADPMDLSPEDRDLVTRTVIGEAAGQPPEGMAAVAHVILNRVRSGQYGGSDVPGVVLARGQFEPWQTRSRELLSYDPDSQIYKKTSALVDQVAHGDIPDPTGGATHFLNPDTVRGRRGGSLPAWAQGPGLTLGDHTFYAPDNPQWTPPSAPFVASPPPGATDIAAQVPTAPTTAPVTRAAYMADDVAETLRAAGVGAPVAQIAPHAPDDVAETMRLLGLKPTPAPTNLVPSTPGRTQITVRPKDAVNVSAPVAPPAYGPPGNTAPDIGLGFQNQLAQGMPIIGPLLNKLTAAAGAGIQPLVAPTGSVPATFGDRYTANLNQLTGDQNTYAANNPVKSTLANLVGGGMALGPLASTRLGGLALGTYGPSLGSRVLSGGVGGGLIGGTDAALRGESPLTGAGLGAAGGVFGPVVGDLAQRGTTFALNYLWPRPQGVLTGLNPVALSKLTGAMEGETPASVAAARERMGPAGFLGDLNPGMTDIAGGIADVPGPGKQVVREAYRTRAAEQRQRVDDALTKAAGPKFDTVDFENSTVEARKAAADPLYEKWRSMEVHPTPELKNLIPRLDKAGAFSMAEELSGITGDPINRTFFTSGDNKKFPTAQSWDYVKQGLDRRIDQAYSSGDKTLARALISLKNDTLSEIEKTDAGQVWKQARKEFATHSAILDQFAAGRDTLLGSRAGASVDELRDELKGLSGPELRARVAGMRAAADEAMGDTVRGDTTLRNRLLAPNNQDKMRLLLGDKKANDLIRTMEQEKYLGDQRQNVEGGSQTTPKKERVNALAPPPSLPWDPNLTQPLSLIPPHLREELRPSSIFSAWKGQRYSSAVNQLAPLMVTPEGPKMDDLLRNLTAESARRSRVGATASRAGNALGALISGPGTTTARRQFFPAE